MYTATFTIALSFFATAETHDKNCHTTRDRLFVAAEHDEFLLSFDNTPVE